MTTDDNTPTGTAVEIGGFLYEAILMIGAIRIGLEMIRMRPDSRHIDGPITVLLDVVAKANEAAVMAQDRFFEAFGVNVGEISNDG